MVPPAILYSTLCTENITLKRSVRLHQNATRLKISTVTSQYPQGTGPRTGGLRLCLLMLKGHSSPPYPQFCIHGFNPLWIIYSKVRLKQIHVQVDPCSSQQCCQGVLYGLLNTRLKFRKNMTMLTMYTVQ